MKWKVPSLTPALLCTGVITLVCLVEWLCESQTRLGPLHRLEWMTYDWRVKQAAEQSPVVATNLGFVAMDNDSIEALLDGSLPYRFGLLWPRQVYGRLIDELSAQGARAIAFDVLFADLRPDHPSVMVDGTSIPSDEFFARSLRRSGNVILASEPGLIPPALFATNALEVAHISAIREHDGILRRTHAFRDARVWHPLIKEAAREFGWDLGLARTNAGQLQFPRRFDEGTNALPFNAIGEVDLGIIERSLGLSTAAANRFEHPYEVKRLWQLGLALAARELNLNLKDAVVDLDDGKIVLSNAQGVRRVIPVDRDGRFYIDWSLGLRSPSLTKGAIEHLLEQFEARQAGRMNEWTNRWRDKLVLVGSTATGNNLNDLGSTPLEQQTFLVNSYWNVANSFLINRFVRPLELSWRLLIIVLLGGLAGICTWNMKTVAAFASVVGMAAAYVALATWAYIDSRLWLPVVTPVIGSLLVIHGTLVTYLVRVERRDRQRTKEVFSRVVSPEIVREILGWKKLSLGGVRRRVTVFFTDIRGFTGVMDTSQQRADRFVAEHHLTAEAAQKHYDTEAATVLNTVNLYLGVAADCIKKHGGTLDKYIGDCVMAFWGAPVPNPQHAV